MIVRAYRRRNRTAAAARSPRRWRPPRRPRQQRPTHRRRRIRWRQHRQAPHPSSGHTTTAHRRHCPQALFAPAASYSTSSGKWRASKCMGQGKGRVRMPALAPTSSCFFKRNDTSPLAKLPLDQPRGEERVMSAQIGTGHIAPASLPVPPPPSPSPRAVLPSCSAIRPPGTHSNHARHFLPFLAMQPTTDLHVAHLQILKNTCTEI